MKILIAIIGSHADVKFRHGICPKRLESVVKLELQRLERQKKERKTA